MANNEFLLYGAYGFTGNLIAKLAGSYGLSPVLAGRDEQKLSLLSKNTGFRYRCFDLENKPALSFALKEVPMVLHAAGPFITTAAPMIKACLETGAHYIDINGDISCFDLIHQSDKEAKDRHIMLLPGSGFDVIPTDCLALKMKQALPDATHLKIAFANLGSMLSHGTAMTMAGKLGEGASKRVNGKIVKTAMGENVMTIDFGIRKKKVINISWGDVFTAYHTTGIPNIETFAAAPEKMIGYLKYQQLFNWILRTDLVRNAVKRRIDTRAAGPDDEMLRTGKSLVWAEVTNAVGKKLTGRLEGPESYLLTAHGALIITKKILGGDFQPGYQTPAGCYGDKLVEEIPGVVIKDINSD